MDPVTIIIILAVVLGFYVAWNIGANDVANAIGTSVGSHALTLKRAVLIAAVFEFAGAFFLGSNVSETLESGIVNPAFFADDPRNFIYGMLASLLASGIWLQIASYFGWPVSTTHTIVGAVLGFGVVVGGFGTIHWDHLGSILVSWVVSPLMGAGLAYLIFSMMRWKIFYHPSPIQATQRMTPYLVFIVFGVLTLITLFNGLKGLHFHLNVFQTIGCAIAIGLVSALIAAFLVRRIHTKQTPEELRRTHNMQLSIALNKAQKHLGRAEAASLGDLHEKVVSVLDEVNNLCDIAESTKEVEIRPSEYKVVERVFAHLQVITACFMAFAHGANDVANAIGPFAAVIKAVSGPLQQVQNRVPTWMLMLGGVGIVMGLATWGWRVIETIGKRITELTPSRGFAAEFGAATTIVLASKLGLPISTTHTLVGAILGVGFARGIEAINLNIVRDIIISWVVTVPIGAALSVIFFYVFKAALG